MTIKDAYLEAARTASHLIAEPAVAQRWAGPSALAGFTVGGLASHLARQVLHTPDLLAQPTPSEAAGGNPIALIEHYTRARWVNSGVDAEPNVAIREAGETQAAAGPAALIQDLATVLDTLPTLLADQPADRTMWIPWNGWSLTLDDCLTTRLLEISIHCDDLAASVDLDTPPLSDSVLDPVLGLLARLAARRHGPYAVLRALSRTERAPTSIAVL